MKPKNIRLLLIFVLFAAALFSACAKQRPQQNEDPPLSPTPLSNGNNSARLEPNRPVNAELEKNRDLWQKIGLRNYNMVAEIAAGGTGDRAPVQIMAFENGSSIVSWKDPALEHNDKNGEMKRKYYDYDSVEKLFDLIRDNSDKEGITLKVSYHKTMGYPVRIETRRPDVFDAYFIFRVKEIVRRADID